MSSTTTTRERPVLFSGEMVKAILDGRKTQTRRPVKLPAKAHAELGDAVWEQTIRFQWLEGPHHVAFIDLCHPTWMLQRFCPFGSPGDRLYVRESFYVDHADYSNGERLPLERPEWADDDLVYYPADARAGVKRWCCDIIPECSCAEVGAPKMRPSILMPRWASRLTLEVTEVRVERIADISREDCIAEGIVAEFHGVPVSGLQHAFSARWNAVYPGSWERNEWVWVVGFKRLEAR